MAGVTNTAKLRGSVIGILAVIYDSWLKRLSHGCARLAHDLSVRAIISASWTGGVKVFRGIRVTEV